MLKARDKLTRTISLGNWLDLSADFHSDINSTITVHLSVIMYLDYTGCFITLMTYFAGLLLEQRPLNLQNEYGSNVNTLPIAPQYCCIFKLNQEY